MKIRASLIAVVLLVLFQPLRLNGQQGSRVWVDPIESRVLVAGQMDSFLLQPSSLDIGRNIIAVFDRGDESLKAVDRATGQLRWEAGRSGRGPWEFASVTDVAMGAADSVWVLDATNQRIYIVGPDGSRGRVINTADALLASGAPYRLDIPYRMAVVSDGFILGLGRTENGLAARFSAEGEWLGTIQGPAWVHALTYMAADYQMDGHAESGNYAAVFQFTGRILAATPETDFTDVQEIGAIATGDEPEVINFELQGMPASRLAPGQVRLARSIAVEGDRIAVLSARQAKEDWIRDVVDVYEDGQYRYSIRLPGAARRIAMYEKTVVVLETEMLPTIRQVIIP